MKYLIFGAAIAIDCFVTMGALTLSLFGLRWIWRCCPLSEAWLERQLHLAPGRAARGKASW